MEPNALKDENQHICAFFNGMDEHYRRPSARSSRTASTGETRRSISSIPSDAKTISRGSRTQASTWKRPSASGQLEVHPWEDGPLHGERFDQDTWLEGFEEVLQSGPASGYAKTRFLAQMEWALVDLPGIDDMIEFETRVNYVVPKYDDPVICAYDLSKFGREHGDVRVADASGRDHRRAAAGESVLRGS